METRWAKQKTMDTKLKKEIPIPKPKMFEDEATEKHHKELERLKALNMKFTGVSFAFIYRPHLGFADYAVVKLLLKDGVIEKVESVSDPLAAFEARAVMETKQAYHLESMRTGYPAEYRHV